jgi:hypothetical protein
MNGVAQGQDWPASAASERPDSGQMEAEQWGMGPAPGQAPVLHQAMQQGVVLTAGQAMPAQPAAVAFGPMGGFRQSFAPLGLGGDPFSLQSVLQAQLLESAMAQQHLQAQMQVRTQRARGVGG